MRQRGDVTWFAIDCLIHTSPKIILLSEKLGLDIDATVGKIARLWSFAKQSRTEDGNIGKLPFDEVAGIMRWKKKPSDLVNSLIECGLLETNVNGEMIIHDWYEMNGKAAERARIDCERHRK